MERGLCLLPDMANFDMKILRKDIFFSNYEQREHLHQMRLRKLYSDKEKTEGSETGLHPTDPIDAFSRDNRALKDTDVLENVAVYLTKNELLTCRLVCNLWSTEMGRFLHKRKSLIVVDEECAKANLVLKNRRNGNPVALSRLCLFDISSGSMLYKKLFSVFGYTLSGISIEECNLTVSDLKRIIVNDAPNLEEFHYKEEKTTRGPRVSPLKQIKLMNNGNLVLPNMKMLHWDEGNGLTELKDVIDTFPNLVTLELRNFPAPKSLSFRNLSWSSLQNMFLSPSVLDEEHCKALTYLNLKLKKLTLFGLNPRERKSMKSLTKFLTSVSKTLESLELWLDYASIIGNPETLNTSPLPVYMPNVTRLQTEIEILGHIKNLNSFPSLTDLELVSNPYERKHWSCLTHRLSIKAQDQLKSLRLGDIDCKSMGKVMKVYPRITSLSVYGTHMDDAFFRSVIKNLPCLTDLSIGQGMVTTLLKLSDSGVTGLSKDSCEQLKLPDQLQKFDANTPRRHPCIEDLQCLQKLDFGTHDSELTDVSVVLGISKLRRLTCLKLPMCKITNLSLNSIEEKLTSLIVLSITGCNQISSEAIEDLKKKRGMIIERVVPPMALQRM
ncbi:unnamed protein product [Orchesella dallaii]|uniref:Uncharacterized protein n=1 Tax=Orchesella dallaii TaxID=48710 RepID=A0ABP1RDA4_9HEXA